MQRVVDASVVAKWFLPEIHKDKAEKLLKDYIDERIDLAAPDLLLAEFGNLIWKRANKIKDITAGQADQIFEDFLALRVPLRDTAGMAATALKHATRRDHPIYDMLYIYNPCRAGLLRVYNGRSNVGAQVRAHLSVFALDR